VKTLSDAAGRLAILPFAMALLLCASPAASQSGNANHRADDARPAASRALGEQLALKGSAGLGACAVCHGALGEGNASAGFPRLAGQAEYYLARQMESFANGSRKNSVMSSIARRMSRAQVEAVSLYYAGLTAPPMPAAAAAPALIERGRTLASAGDASRQVQACVNCHGPAGTGEQPAFPYLAGQHGAYLVSSLAQWRNGTRRTDPTQQMNIIARQLGEQDIEAVAAYFASQAPPAPAARRINIPAGSVMRPVKPGAPSAATPEEAKGVGTEQGAATTGGSVGIGGGGSASGGGPTGSKSGEAK
jgi:cytochrome c553